MRGIIEQTDRHPIALGRGWMGCGSYSMLIQQFRCLARQLVSLSFDGSNKKQKNSVFENSTQTMDILVMNVKKVLTLIMPSEGTKRGVIRIEFYLKILLDSKFF